MIMILIGVITFISPAIYGYSALTTNQQNNQTKIQENSEALDSMVDEQHQIALDVRENKTILKHIETQLQQIIDKD